MRRQLALLAISMVAGLFLGSPDAKAEVQFSAGLQIQSAADFYEPLTPSGAWVTVGSYGRCWHPARVAAGWRPYCNGEWVWTDCGWYWQSDEPWAWACYHYGYWVMDPAYGWVWVPGTEWAPAWVTWCEGPEYIGWAPCGPGYAAPAASFFVFVGIGDFHHHFHERDLIVNNPTIFRQTRVINNFTRTTVDIGGTRQAVRFNPGPSVDPIQRATRTTFRQQPIQQVITQTRVPETLRNRQSAPAREREQEVPRSSTGREQPRDYERPPSSAPEATPRRSAPESVPPSSPRPAPEKPRESVPQRPSEAVPRQAPPESVPRERALPPTGRERGYERPPAREASPRESVPQRPPEAVPRQAPPESVPRERALPPTGRERGFERPPAREQPARPAPAPERKEPNRPPDEKP